MVRILLDTAFRYGGQSTVRRGNSMYRCVVREGEVRVGLCFQSGPGLDQGLRFTFFGPVGVCTREETA